MQPESDGGLDYLEKKLGIFILGPAQTRRNAALDILTGRVADERLVGGQPPSAQPTPAAASVPVPIAPTRIHPDVGYRTPRAFRLASDALPAADWASRASISPWLAASDVQRPRFRILRPNPPAPSRWPLVRSLLLAATTMSVVLAAGFGFRIFTERADVAPVIDLAPELALSSTVPVDVAPVDLAPEADVIPAATVAAAEVEVIPPVAIARAEIVTPVVAVAVPVSTLRVLVDERFTSNAGAWPNNPQGPGWYADGTYRLAASEVSHFVAVGIPGAQTLGNAVVTGWFRKIGGPAGGGYGLILRDQDPALRDGRNQSGRYYVFEVGDRGEVGVWLRDGDQWLDLMTWTASDAVKPGTASNELMVTTAGDQLSFLVNGILVASQTDTALRRGGAGVFVGGDSNQVVLDRITVSSSD